MDRLIAGEGGRAARELRDVAARAAEAWSPVVAWIAEHPQPPDATEYAELIRRLNAYGAAFEELPGALRALQRVTAAALRGGRG